MTGQQELSKLENKLTPDQKEKIDTQLFWLEETLNKLDAFLLMDLKKDDFTKLFGQLFDEYSDMVITSKIDKKIAKGTLMMNLRNHLTVKFTKQKGETESTIN